VAPLDEKVTIPLGEEPVTSTTHVVEADTATVDGEQLTDVVVVALLDGANVMVWIHVEDDPPT